MKKFIIFFMLFSTALFLGQSFAQQAEAWKTIQHGKYISLSQIPSTVKIMDWGAEMLSGYPFPKTKDLVNLVKISVKDLGFKNGANYIEIYEVATKLGLKLCHPIDAVYLREIYMEQTENERLYLAMEPITDKTGEKDVLSLGHNGTDFWVNGAIAKDMPSKNVPEEKTYVVFNPGTWFVFRI